MYTCICAHKEFALVTQSLNIISYICRASMTFFCSLSCLTVLVNFSIAVVWDPLKLIAII